MHRSWRGVYEGSRGARDIGSRSPSRSGLDAAVAEVLTSEVGARGEPGGVIVVGEDGQIVVAHNSPARYAAFRSDDLVVLI